MGLREPGSWGSGWAGWEEGTLGGFQRSSKFGYPPPQPGSSAMTTRFVPLTTGVRLDLGWASQPQGSSTSMTNLLPIDGALVPRSRMSSLNTIRTLNAPIAGMAECVSANGGAPRFWVSGSTLHGVLQDPAAGGQLISKASFTSAFGVGTHSGVGAAFWNYTPAYFSGINENALIAAMSPNADQLQVLYETGTGNSIYRNSYLTGAPSAYYVTSYDNYVIALNISIGGGNRAAARLQWCARGSPSAWTQEGSGFEDLLASRGAGTGIKVLGNQLIVFTEFQLWTGQSATYPSQFRFDPLDTEVGCPYPRTIVETELGIIFLGSDLNLRLLPKGGGVSQVISRPMSKILRYRLGTQDGQGNAFGVFDPVLGIYHLFYGLQTKTGAADLSESMVLGTDSGAWGFATYTTMPYCGVAAPRLTLSTATRAEGMFFGSSGGTVYSTNSLSGTENGSVVTATWRSTPIAADLPGNYKQLRKVFLDYRSTSSSTHILKISQDGGNTYEATGVVMSLASAPASGRKEQDVYSGGAYPAIELTSTSTGYELHRIDVTLNVGGRG